MCAPNVPRLCPNQFFSRLSWDCAPSVPERFQFCAPTVPSSITKLPMKSFIYNNEKDDSTSYFFRAFMVDHLCCTKISTFKQTSIPNHWNHSLFHTAPCSAGDYMTDSGCQQCGENTFSGDGASSCTSCPDNKISAAGSTSEDDCQYSKLPMITELIFLEFSKSTMLQ